MKKSKLFSILIPLFAMSLAGCGTDDKSKQKVTDEEKPVEKEMKSDSKAHWEVDAAGNMVGTRVNHTFEEDASQAKAATCKEKGEKVEKCTVCGYVKKTATNKLTHNYVEVTAEYVAPTCTSTGKKVEKCSLCNDVKETTLDKIAHTFAEVTAEYVAPTCTAKGKKVEKCSVCDELKETELDMIPHTYVEQREGYVDPTCSTKGKKVEKCSVCDDILETDIPTTPHDFGDAVLATTEGGREYNTYECNVCNGKASTLIKFTDYASITGTFSDGKLSTNPVGEPVWNVCLPEGDYDVYFEAKYSSSGEGKSLSSRSVYVKYNGENVEFDRNVTESDLGLSTSEYRAFTFVTIHATGGNDTLSLQNPHYRFVFDANGYIEFKPVQAA